ncbi:hypothetical protein AAAC51_34385 [Priestia megaterium]
MIVLTKMLFCSKGSSSCSKVVISRLLSPALLTMQIVSETFANVAIGKGLDTNTFTTYGKGVFVISKEERSLKMSKLSRLLKSPAVKKE